MARAPEWAERTSSHSAWAPLVVLLPAVVVLSDNEYGAFMDEIGSFKDAPLIGPNDAKTQLDLIPRDAEPPFDEYGASYAAFQGNTPILPSGCP